MRKSADRPDMGVFMDLSTLLPRYKVPCRGVIHAGAHVGQEVEQYLQLGFEHGVFFEPQPQMIECVKEKVRSIPKYRAVEAALGEAKGVGTLYTETTNWGMSASLLKPKDHLIQYPQVQFDGSIQVPVTTLSDYFKTDDIRNYNFLNMDVQGFELSVLKGGMAIISALDAIYAEVNRAELYEGCAQIEQIDSFLSEFNFQRVELYWACETWGEALYVKRP